MREKGEKRVGNVLRRRNGKEDVREIFKGRKAKGESG